MYPATLINLNLYPRHLGEDWIKGIEKNYNHRANVLKPKLKTLDKSSEEYKRVSYESEAYKLAVNGGAYGKLGSEYSWQYDPLQKYKVTFYGQLSLLMLMEAFYLNGIELVSANTDGVVIYFHKDKMEVVQNIHKWWENVTMYELEDTYYNQIIQTSVNDYMAEIIDPDTKKRIKVKYKGDFEIDKDYHKNCSQRIVPIAVKEYFINNVPVSDTIVNIGKIIRDSKENEERTTIYDYLIGRKGRNSEYLFVSEKENKLFKDKVIVYYVSRTRCKLYKRFLSGKKKGDVQSITKGFHVTPFMEYSMKEDYEVDYNYYINEVNKIIKPIIRGSFNWRLKETQAQLKLF